MESLAPLVEHSLTSTRGVVTDAAGRPVFRLTSRVRDGERAAFWQAALVDEQLRAQGAPDEVLLQAISLPTALPSYVLRRALEGSLVEHPRIAFVHSAALPRASLQAIQPGEPSPLLPPLQALPLCEQLGLVLVVKEWLPTVPLLTWRELRGDRVRLQDVLDVVDTLADAVGALHRRGFVHGGLTPDIVGLQLVEGSSSHGQATGRSWVAKLLELGLVRMLTPREAWPDRIASLWCAPEAFAPESSTDLRLSDQLSMAAMLFALCTDQLPFDPVAPGTPPTVAAELRRRQIEQLAPPRGNDRARALGVTPALSAACLRALSPNPDERFPSVEAFAKAVRDACHEEQPRRIRRPGEQAVPGTVPSSIVASLFRRPAVFASETLPSILVESASDVSEAASGVSEAATDVSEALPQAERVAAETPGDPVAGDAQPVEQTASEDARSIASAFVDDDAETPPSGTPVVASARPRSAPGNDTTERLAEELVRTRRLSWALGVGWAATVAYLLLR